MSPACNGRQVLLPKGKERLRASSFSKRVDLEPMAVCLARTQFPRIPQDRATWLGSIVHDPDESLGQQMVVGGFLSFTWHWELDSF